MTRKLSPEELKVAAVEEVAVEEAAAVVRVAEVPAEDNMDRMKGTVFAVPFKFACYANAGSTEVKSGCGTPRVV